jgi:hypothetical protein
MKNEGENMEPQSARRKTLCFPGEYPLKDGGGGFIIGHNISASKSFSVGSVVNV